MNILPDSRYERVHTGSAIEIKRLQLLLEEKDIPSIVRDDNESAKLGGYALGSPDQTRLLVHKDYLVTAKHIIQNALNSFEDNPIADESLERLSQEDSQKAIINKITRPKDEKKRPEISTGRLLFYVLFLGYSLWRLSPLLSGEELPLWRIVVSGALSIFCIYMLVNYFLTRNKA